jgi:hypothetical protein
MQPVDRDFGDELNISPPVRQTLSFAPPMISPSLHENAIADIAPGDGLRIRISEAIRAGRLATENARAASVAIHSDTNATPGAASLQASEHSYKLTAAVLPNFDRAREALETEVSRLKAKTNAPPADTSARGNFMATEIRQRLVSLDQTKRMTELAKAINAGPSGDAVVEAALNASGFLTGLSPAEQDHIRETWRHKRYPDEMKRIAQLEKDAAALNLGGQIVMTYPMKCADAGVLAEAKASMAAVQKAIAQATVGAH